MSDYLGNLAARAVRAPDQIRPRLPSLFEPVDAPGVNGAEFVEMEEERRAAPPRAPRVAPPVHSQEGVEAREPERRRPPRSAAREDLQRPRPEPPVTRVQGVMTEGGEHPARETRIPRPVQAAPVIPEPDPVQRTAQAPPAPPTPAPARIAETPQPVRARAFDAVPATPPERRGRERWEPPQVPAPPRASAERPLALPTAAPRKPEQPSAHFTPPPSITVTIGRVEVKAVTVADEPRRPAPKTRRPNLPLDEYLRRRNGGSR